MNDAKSNGKEGVATQSEAQPRLDDEPIKMERIDRILPADLNGLMAELNQIPDNYRGIKGGAPTEGGRSDATPP